MDRDNYVVVSPSPTDRSDRSQTIHQTTFTSVRHRMSIPLPMSMPQRRTTLLHTQLAGQQGLWPTVYKYKWHRRCRHSRYQWASTSSNSNYDLNINLINNKLINLNSNLNNNNNNKHNHKHKRKRRRQSPSTRTACRRRS